MKTRLIEQNDSTSVDTTLKLHTEHFDEVPGVSEVNFEEQNDVETRDGKTNHWIALIIVLSAGIIIHIKGKGYTCTGGNTSRILLTGNPIFSSSQPKAPGELL